MRRRRQIIAASRSTLQPAPAPETSAPTAHSATVVRGGDVVPAEALPAVPRPVVFDTKIPSEFLSSVSTGVTETPEPESPTKGESTPPATAAGAAKLEGQATILARGVAQMQAGTTLTLLPENWAAEKQQALQRLDAILPLLEQIRVVAAEAETAYRDRRGIGDNRPPEAIDLPIAASAAISAANVFRTEISAPQPRFEVIRVCSDSLKMATKLMGAGLAALALGFLGEIGKQVADEVWPALEPLAHQLIAQSEAWLRVLGL